MNIANGIIVGTKLANEIKEIYIINNHREIINNPKIKIIKHSNKNFIGKTGELIYKGKKYSMIEFDIKNETNNNGYIPYYINPIHRISNDCFKIINN